MARKPYFNSLSGKVSLKNGRSVAVMMAFGNGERLRGRIEVQTRNNSVAESVLVFSDRARIEAQGVVLGEKRLLFAAKTLVKALLSDRNRIIRVSIGERPNLIEWNFNCATT